MKDKVVTVLMAVSLISLYASLRLGGMTADKARKFIDTMLISTGRAVGMTDAEVRAMVNQP